MATTSTAGLAQCMRFRLAAATPSRWVDAIVTDAPDATSLTVVELASGRARRLVHGGTLDGAVAAGDPVAVHPTYGVLAVGDARHDVAAG